MRALEEVCTDNLRGVQGLHSRGHEGLNSSGGDSRIVVGIYCIIISSILKGSAEKAESQANEHITQGSESFSRLKQQREPHFTCQQVLIDWSSCTLQRKLSHLLTVDMQHAPAKLPSKINMFAYVDVLAQSLCSQLKNRSFLGVSACQLQAVEKVFFEVLVVSVFYIETKYDLTTLENNSQTPTGGFSFHSGRLRRAEQMNFAFFQQWIKHRWAAEGGEVIKGFRGLKWALEEGWENRGIFRKRSGGKTGSGCLAKSLFHLQKNSYISFAHPISLDIIFEFQNTVNDHKEFDVIHAQGHIFCLEMVITNISYGHHSMTLIFFFNAIITLRMWIKALLDRTPFMQFWTSRMNFSKGSKKLKVVAGESQTSRNEEFLVSRWMACLYINYVDLHGKFKLVPVPSFGLVSLAWLCCVVSARLGQFMVTPGWDIYRSVLLMFGCSLAHSGVAMAQINILGYMFPGFRPF
ncbi:hypothetical protein VP01_2819g1 [Puccinia sorghi]|uniref:Uncharacterized protein n=1 Tax=Puccinia sorghi TaxID=27349 RepID=A0A0L6V2C8_9BASI|nr:hypothetical protein VP01_2819g1 [Puccinia sorghi]